MFFCLFWGAVQFNTMRFSFFKILLQSLFLGSQFIPILSIFPICYLVEVGILTIQELIVNV